MFLATQTGEFLIIAVAGIIVIAIALLVYFIATNKKNKEESLPKEEPLKKEPEKVKEPVPIQTPAPVFKQENEITPQEPINPKTPEEDKTDSNIQKFLNRMQEDLDKSKAEDYQESINRYEDDEEANAIISYKELMKYKENRNKDIVLEDRDKDEIKDVLKSQEEFEYPKEEVKKFKRSEFISPIFGYNEDTNVTYREIKRPPRKENKLPDSEAEWESDRMLKNLEDNTAEVMDFEEQKEIDNSPTRSDEFLDALVDFRRKLD